MSAILQTFTIRAKKGKLEEARAEVERAKEIYLSRGATSARLFWAIDAGKDSGDAILAVEYANAVTWASVVDAEDEEMRRVREHLANRKGPVEILGTALLREVS